MEPEQLERYAKLAPCFFAVMGTVFMAKCKNAWHPILNKTGWKKDGVFACSQDAVFLRWASLASHMFFILGAVIFANGLLAIANVLELPPVLGFWVMSSTVVNQITYMALFKQSPMGTPDIDGPPIPARLIIAAVWIVTTANYIVNRATLYKDVDEVKLFGLMAAGILVPSLIGAKHRGVHWRIQDTSDLPSRETAKTY